ncbi:MFS transporter [Mycobacterium sp. E3298]|uniref:MFS transporter n=1 Tax=Mycobacterium sp. E3298 TaxID=1856865 RepID=UPI0007FE1354|nr:MFS transporter [Mycobacterium sp. E3298]OBG93359.1 MFS transporter [Mycobacterium sp. E3298]
MTASIPRTIGTERRNWFALAVLLVGAFMALLDSTIVNVALPAIRTSLSASNATLSWIVSGYALAFGLALIPAGRVGDRFGHKWVFIAGLSLFTMASLACGLAQGEGGLVCARAVQGLGGGIFFTPITALIQLMFAARKRARALAIMGSTIGFSVALGPLIGGLIIQAFGADPGWRLVFDVNVPLGVLAVVAAAILLPAGTERAASADWVGLILLSAALVALLVPLIQGQQDGWPLWTYASMAGAVALLVVFAQWERHVETNGGNPLVPPRLFSHASFTGGVLLALVYFAAFTSIFFTIALLWQAGLGHTALQSGLVVTPFAIGLVGGASQSDSLAARFGRTVLVVGLGMVAVGITAIWLVLALTPGTAYGGWQLAAPLLIAGLGSGLFIAPNVDFIVATVDAADAGAASGVIGTAQRVGSAIGIAIIGTVLFGTLHVRRAGPEALAAAFGHSATLAMAASAALSVAAFALVFALPRRSWDR